MPDISPPAVEPSRRYTSSNAIDLFRPMLSASLPSAKKAVPTQEEVLRDLLALDWERGFLVSPKMDGIRAIKHPDLGLVSRTLKPIPNKWVQQCLSLPFYDHLDGEIVAGKWWNPLGFNDTQSLVMTAGGEFEFSYCVFDDITEPNNAFWWRSRNALERVRPFEDEHPQFHLIHLEQKLVVTVDELLDYEALQVQKGYEGVIVRDPGKRYKNNRSTYKEQGMIKLKRFTDGEAVVIGFDELQRNSNAANIDKLGFTKRSDHLAGMVGANTLGRLRVRGIGDPWDGTEFWIGSGLDDGLRGHIWDERNRHNYLGRIVKFKSQAVGAKDLPRTPIFLSFRSPDDL